MDFTLSKQQLMAQKMYREFAENEVKPLAASSLRMKSSPWQSRWTPKNTSPKRPSKRWASWG